MERNAEKRLKCGDKALAIHIAFLKFFLFKRLEKNSFNEGLKGAAEMRHQG